MKKLFTTLSLTILFLNLLGQAGYDLKYNLTICTKTRNASAVLLIKNGLGNTFTGVLNVDTYQRNVSGWYFQKICEGNGFNYSTEGLAFYADLSSGFQLNQLFKGLFNFDKTYISGEYFYAGNEFIFYGTKSAITSTGSKVVQSEVNVFPNPTMNYLYVDADINSYAYSEIYDLSGKLISKVKFNPTIDVRNLNPGNYVLKLINDNNRFDTIKFFKE